MSPFNGVPLNPEPNLPLVPIISGHLGNAILISSSVKSGQEQYIVVTDFGNQLVLNRQELIARFSVPHWYYEMPEGYPRATLRERFTAQIVLLHEALRLLDD